MSTSTLLSAIVTNGPSADAVIDSLKYAFKARKLPVHFTVDIQHSAVGYQRGVEFDANIIGVSYESGAPGMLIIEFQIVGKSSYGQWGICKGFYNANRRTGTFELNM